MASKRAKRRKAQRELPKLSEKTGMTSEQLLAHRELEFVRSGFQGTRKRAARKAALLREAEQINGLRPA